MGHAVLSPVKLGIEAGNALPTPIPLCMPPFPRRHLTLPTFVPDFSGRNNSLMPKVTMEAMLMLTSRINKNISKHQINVLDFISRIAVETNCTSLRHLVLNIFVHKQFTMCRDSNGSLNCFTSCWNTHTVWEFRAAWVCVAPIPVFKRNRIFCFGRIRIFGQLKIRIFCRKRIFGRKPNIRHVYRIFGIFTEY